MQGIFWKRCVMLFIVAGAISALAACGSGGEGSDDSGGGGNAGNGGNDGGGPTVDPSTVPGLNANGDIDDGQGTTIYASPDDSQVIRINLTILKADPEGICRGENDSAGPEDYSGCTLADLNGGDDPNDLGDTDGGDDFDPELSGIAEIPGENIKLVSDGGMEVRGASSRLTKQKSYKFEFEEQPEDIANTSAYQEANGEFAPDWHGMRRFQLNKHPYDLSRIRNKLSFDLFRQIADFPSLRTQFVHLYVYDENEPEKGQQDFGLFTNIEYMDEHWAENHGQDKNANIFKAEQFSFRSPEEEPAVTADADSDEFETVLESKGDNEDTTALLEMLTALNDDQKAFSGTFNRYFHPDNFRTWLAINILVSNLDTNSQNFYLYRPEAIDNFYFTPWDYDAAFDFFGQPDENSERPRWQEGVANWWDFQIVRRYIKAGAGNVQALTDKIDALYASTLNPDNVRSIINAYPLDALTQIETAQPDLDQLPLDPDSGDSAEAQRDAEIDRIPTTIDAAREQYKKTLNRPMPVFLEVRVNGSNNVELGWDASYDIQNQPLVYDVRLSRNPALNTTQDACTDADVPMPSLTGDVFTADNLKTTSVVPATALTPGRYYLQVIVRDSDGYCQSAFDQYNDGDGQSYFGVFAFDFDGTDITQVGG